MARAFVSGFKVVKDRDGLALVAEGALVGADVPGFGDTFEISVPVVQGSTLATVQAAAQTEIIRDAQVRGLTVTQVQIL